MNFTDKYPALAVVIDYIFPRQCISCSTPWAYLCKTCKRNLDPHPEICPYCHRTSKDYLTCLDCRTEKSNYLEWIIIPFAYTTLLKKLIIKLKYFHKKDISEFLIDRLTIALQANESFQRKIHICPPFSKEGVPRLVGEEDLSHETQNPSDGVYPDIIGTTCPYKKETEEENNKNSKLFISFIPSHRYRHYFVKGYNQSELLAKKLGENLQVPTIAIAKKKKHTKTQASLDRNWRLHNLKNAFSLVQNLPFKGNETILIVDDITTTGSTINELAKLIKHYYPKIKVRWAVLWRHT